MSQYQPGRLALIISAMDKENQKFVGMCVELITFCPHNKQIVVGGQHICSIQGDAWLVLGSNGKYYLKLQRNLMPIDDPTQFSDDAYGQAIQDMNKKKGKKDD